MSNFIPSVSLFSGQSESGSSTAQSSRSLSTSNNSASVSMLYALSRNAFLFDFSSSLGSFDIFFDAHFVWVQIINQVYGFALLTLHRSSICIESASPATQMGSSESTPAHHIALIAGVTISVAVVLLLALLACIYLRRRRSLANRHNSQTHAFLAQEEALSPPYPESAPHSVSGYRSTWMGEPVSASPTAPSFRAVERLRARQSVPTLPKGPHYTVRTRASLTDVYGFGQDLAWQDAHYVDPLPVASAPAGEQHQPHIDVTPPTPLLGTAHSRIPSSETPFLRSHSATSSISSEYSVASPSSSPIPTGINNRPFAGNNHS
ncbi:hypothetical protein C8J57DRAFT_1508293 [Mycena rebaudengoi]|nr:hypothetical protein C8J57DRAFT_1508293 [Mycena rebaudengoi]